MNELDELARAARPRVLFCLAILLAFPVAADPPRRAADDVPALMAAVEGGDQGTAIRAIRRLGDLKAKDAAPLLKALIDSNVAPAPARAAAAEALRRIGPLTRDEEVWLDQSHRYVKLDGVCLPVPEMNLGRGGDLPSLKIGASGRVSGGFRVLQVVGPSAMLVNGLWSWGSDRRPTQIVMVRGASTEGVIDGQFYLDEQPPPDGTGELAIIGTTTYATAFGSKTVPLAVPLRLLRRGISFADFQDMKRQEAASGDGRR